MRFPKSDKKTLEFTKLFKKRWRFPKPPAFGRNTNK